MASMNAVPVVGFAAQDFCKVESTYPIGRTSARICSRPETSASLNSRVKSLRSSWTGAKQKLFAPRVGLSSQRKSICGRRMYFRFSEKAENPLFGVVELVTLAETGFQAETIRVFTCSEDSYTVRVSLFKKSRLVSVIIKVNSSEAFRMATLFEIPIESRSQVSIPRADHFDNMSEAYKCPVSKNFLQVRTMILRQEEVKDHVDPSALWFRQLSLRPGSNRQDWGASDVLDEEHVTTTIGPCQLLSLLKLGYRPHVVSLLVKRTENNKDHFYARLYMSNVLSRAQTVVYLEIELSEAMKFMNQFKVPIDLPYRVPTEDPEALEFSLVKDLLIAVYEERYPDAARLRDKLEAFRGTTEASRLDNGL